MLRRLFATVTVAILVVGAPHVYAGVDPGDLCKEKKAKAAGKKAFALMKAFGKNTKKPNPVKLGNDISKAQSKFTKGFTKAEGKGGCPTSGDSDAIEAKVDALIGDVMAALSGTTTTTLTVPGTTTTTVTVPSTTTTLPPAGCGNGTLDPGEECDGSDDAVCPGECQPDCTCFSQGHNCPQGTEDPIDIAHQATFDAILNRLLSDFWQENGDWLGDLQGDATTFGAPALFRLGCMERNTGYVAKAIATVDWEHFLMIENMPAILQGEVPPMFMETVMGAPALVDGHYYTADEGYRTVIQLALSTLHQLMRVDPDFLGSAMITPIAATGKLISTSMYYSRVTGDASMAEDARLTLDAAIARWWDEGSGHFLPHGIITWDQGAMLEALSLVYADSGEESYRDKAIMVGQWVLANLKDEATGGVWSSGSSNCKSLSGNCFITGGLLELYSVTGDVQWLNEAEGIFAYLLSDQIYDSAQSLCQHHYCTGEGRADYFCTGCNFFLLRNLLRYGELTSGS